MVHFLAKQDLHDLWCLESNVLNLLQEVLVVSVPGGWVVDGASDSKSAKGFLDLGKLIVQVRIVGHQLVLAFVDEVDVLVLHAA